MNAAVEEQLPTTTGQKALDWWRSVLSNGDRGVRAQLRRCRSPLEAVAVPAAISLARRLSLVPTPTDPIWKQRAFERVMGLGIVLAHVEVANQIPLLRALGWGQFPYDKSETDVVEGRPTLSELRFKRLLQTEGEDELIAAFTRLLRLAGGEADVADLARIYLQWEYDRTKRDLALTYYRATTYGLDARV